MENHSLSSRRRDVPRTRLLVAAIAMCFAEAGHALPVGPQIVAGTANFNQTNNALTINNSNNAILNWQSFNIGASEAVRFNQPSASSSVLNRVLASDPSKLLGQLASNGRVWLVNPAGILVGPGARIDTAGFVASTLNVRNEDFLAGRLTFQNTPGAGSVVNQGAISTPEGGSVYLVAPNVSNEGIITTPQGETILAAGQTVELLDTATPGVKVEVTGASGNVTNLGTIVAEAGKVGMVGVLVKNSGNLNASSVVNEGGRVFLKASRDTYVDKAAKVTATGSKGGRIEVLGDRVAVMDNAQLDASGQQGGGTVLVGGDKQGKNPEIQNASIAYFGKDASLKADAQQAGDGGKVIVWAEDTTRAYGVISAKGGEQSGNGGFVETSGHRYLDFQGKVDTGAPHGQAGTLLLDPADITIDNSTDALNGGSFSGGIFSNATSNPVITWNTINTQTGSLTIQTSPGTGGTNGDININASGTVTGPSSLTLLANGSINLANNVAVSGSGDFNLIAGWNNTGWAVSSGAGKDINFGTSASLATTGNVYFNAGNNINVNVSGATISAHTLEINALGAATISSGANQVDILAANTTGNFSFSNSKSSGLTIGTGATMATQGVSSPGNVSIYEFGGNLDVTQSVQAGGGILLSSSNATHVAASKVVSGSYLTISTSGGAITIDGTLFATSAQIDSVGSAIATGATGLVTANYITFQPYGGTNGAIGSSGAPVKTSSPGGTGNAYITFGTSGYGPSAVYLTHTGDATLQTSYTQANAPISIGVSNNLTATSLNAGTSNLELKAGNLLTVPNGVTLSGANITLAADRMDLQGAASTINTGSGVLWVKPATANGTWNIDLGSAVDSTASTLELSTSELNTLAGTTGSTLRIGAMSAGNLHLSGPVAPTGFSTGTLSFESGGAVDQATSADIITIDKLAVKALGNVNLDVAPNLVTNLAASVGDATHQNNNFSFKNSPTLNIASGIDAVSGISVNVDANGYAPGSPNSVIALTSGAGLTQAAGALLAGKAVYAEGARVNLNEANPTGMIAGKATGSAAGDTFIYKSSNGIHLTTVNGFSGIQTGNPSDAASVLLTAGSAGIGQDTAALINAGAGIKGLMVDTTGAVNLTSSTNSVGALATGASAPSQVNFVNAGAMTIGITGNGINTSTANGPVSVSIGSGLLTVQEGIAAGSGNVALEAPNIQLGVAAAAPTSISGGLVKLRANQPSTGAISMGATTTASTINGSDIVLEADNFALTVSPSPVLTATNTVAYRTVSDNANISVNNALGVATINAPWLVIGNDVASDTNTTGNINVDVAINRPGQGVVLLAGGTITQTAPITAQNLAVIAGTVSGAGGGVTLNSSNQVTTLAGTSSGGAISFTNAANLTVGVVSDGTKSATGLSSGNGAVTIANSAGNTTLSSAINAGSGNIAIDAGTGNFVNSVGAGAMTTSSRWLVYAASPAVVTKNGLTSAFRHYNATYANYASPGESGNGFIYASTPGSVSVDTTLLSGALTSTYGQAPTAVYGYSTTGTIDKEDISGTATFTPAISNVTAAGNYTITYASGLTSASSYSGSTMANPVSYTLTPGTGLAYTVNPAALTITAILAGSTNKVYDGTTNATLTSGNFQLSGFVNSDSATVTKTSGTYASKNVGTGLLVSTSLVSGDFNPSGGTNLANYVLPTSASGNIGTITPASLSVSGIKASDKIYDGNTGAKLDVSAALLAGLISGDSVGITGTGSFADKNVGSAKPVAISGITLSGADAGNYTLTNNTASASASITPASLNVSSISVGDKVYDGTIVATLNTGTAALAGLISGDNVTVAGTGSFADKNVGAAKPVTVSGITLSGADAGNYMLSGTTATTSANITPASLSISGLNANNKVYDGTTGATLNTGSATLSGIVSGDNVSLGTVSGNFADKNVGKVKPVMLASLSLSGTDAGNYVLVQPSGLVADITPCTIAAVAGITAADKVDDGTTAATLNTGAATFAGMISGDSLSVGSATGNFADPAAGIGKVVNIGGITLSGGDAANYVLANNTATTTASITAAAGSGSTLVETSPVKSSLDQVVTTVTSTTQQQSSTSTTDTAVATGSTTVLATSSPTLTSGLTTQTIGGTAGEFGGTSSTASTTTTGTTSASTSSDTTNGGASGSSKDAGSSDEDAKQDKEDKKDKKDKKDDNGESGKKEKADSDKAGAKKPPMCS